MYCLLYFFFFYIFILERLREKWKSGWREGEREREGNGDLMEGKEKEKARGAGLKRSSERDKWQCGRVRIP